MNGNDGKTVGRFDSTRKVWSKSGELTSERWSHYAIYDGSTMIVVGGDGSRKTERCEISDGQVTCTPQNHKLYRYEFNPELFLVSVDFCKTL